MQRRTVLLLGAAPAVSPAVKAHAHPDHPPHTRGDAPRGGGALRRGPAKIAPIASGPRQEHSVAAVGDNVFLVGGIVPDASGGITTTGQVGASTTRARDPSVGARHRCPSR